MEGSYIIARRNIGGHRDYLDDEPISAGAGLDLYDDGLWIPGRYEVNAHQGEGFFYYTDAQGQDKVLRIDRETMRFRWPQ